MSALPASGIDSLLQAGATLRSGEAPSLRSTSHNGRVPVPPKNGGTAVKQMAMIQRIALFILAVTCLGGCGTPAHRPGEGARQLADRDPPGGRRPEPGDTMKADLGGGVTMELAWIPAGEFDMGSRERDNERPIHRVRISHGFWMGKFEVTNGQYRRFLEKRDHEIGHAAAPSRPAPVAGSGNEFAGPEHPMIWVTWDNAQAFCHWMSGQVNGTARLPTEAEWEYACRAGMIGQFWSGNADSDLDAAAWHAGNSGGQTHPVGRKRSNAWGLHDVSGNVWEWCQDWYGAYSADPATDPAGPWSGTNRVLRGGSWDTYPLRCRSAYRNFSEPACACDYYGFRIVVTAR